MPANKTKQIIKKRFLTAVDEVSGEIYPKKSQADVIKSIGMAPSNFYKMRKEKGSYPTLDHCYKLCTVYSISAEWLITGNGFMKRIEEKQADPIRLLKQAVAMLQSKETEHRKTAKKLVNKPVNKN